jgi:hypothetical protein
MVSPSLTTCVLAQVAVGAAAAAGRGRAAASRDSKSKALKVKVAIFIIEGFVSISILLTIFFRIR